jgi:hypothetical protein
MARDGPGRNIPAQQTDELFHLRDARRFDA